MDKLKSLKNKTKILSTVELLEKLIDEDLARVEAKLDKVDTSKLSAKESRSRLLAPLDTSSPGNKLEPEQVNVTRYIPVSVKRSVWKRAGGKCEWIHPITKIKCNSIFYLQYDHFQPYSLDGKNTSTNIRLLCSNHNIYFGINHFGLHKMKRV